MEIRPLQLTDAAAWSAMRSALWPGSESVHKAEVERFFQHPLKTPQAVFVAEQEGQGLVGFAELSIRNYAEGCITDHVAYLEGWYVKPSYRGLGIGRRLVETAENWGREQGCTEFASDAEVDNQISAKAHQACGFEEVEVVRCFRKVL